jgi:hypothetical protein
MMTTLGTINEVINEKRFHNIFDFELIPDGNGDVQGELFDSRLFGDIVQIETCEGQDNPPPDVWTLNVSGNKTSANIFTILENGGLDLLIINPGDVFFRSRGLYSYALDGSLRIVANFTNMAGMVKTYVRLVVEKA